MLLAANITFAQPQPHGPDTLWTYTYSSSIGDKAYTIISSVDEGFIVGGTGRDPDGAGGALLIRLDRWGRFALGAAVRSTLSAN